MVEVFKTNVSTVQQAALLICQIQQTFCSYKANFDLEDCDNILRVECKISPIDSASLISLLKKYGFQAEILPDETIIINSNTFRKRFVS